MKNNNKVIDVLVSLQLERLSDDWVKVVWDSDFTSTDDTNEELLQDIDSSELIESVGSLLTCLDSWVTDSDDKDLWTTLVEKEISLKAVIAFLSYLLLTGHKKSADVSRKVLGILAGRAYCKLLLVPGSSAFNIFHPELFEKTLDFLKWFIVLGVVGNTKRKRSETPVKSSQGKRKSKQKHKKQSSEVSLEDGIEDLSGSQALDDEDEVPELAPQEITQLRKHLHTLLVEILCFLEKYSLRGSASSAHHSVKVLALLTSHDTEQFDGNFESSLPARSQSVAALVFKCLQTLCLPLHGHVDSLMNDVCKCLLPNLLMLVGGKAVPTVTKKLEVTKDHAVTFVCLLMKQCGDRGLKGVRTLVQHMCTKVTDRAEYRTKVAQAVVTLAREMPNTSYVKLVEWFYKLSKHSQINNRGFALEIISALMAAPERAVTEEVPIDLQLYTTHRFLLGILLGMCSDIAPSVRARAITCFAQCLTSRDEGIADTVKEIVTPACSNRPNVPILVKTPGGPLTESVTIDYDTSKKSEVTIAQQTIEGSTVVQTSNEGGAREKDTPLHGVYLTPGFNPNLTDNEGVFSMLRRRARDDKVNVRKSAVQALEAAVRFENPNYTKQNVEVLKEHCRDPGLSVRKQALQSLTDLLTDFPKDKFLQSYWLKAALPLVIDRESTLSEKCMESLEEIILSNIVLHVRSKNEGHILAWDLLTIIAKPESVDQRRYLQKACLHWSREGKIKANLIKALQSHVGTDSNSAAWMLLAEIAPAAPKIVHDFILEYWHNNAQQEKCTEIMNRVLTVMKCVAKHLQPTERLKLIDDLKSRLMRFDSPSELISVSVNTLSKLCDVHAKEANSRGIVNSWSRELLKASDVYLSKVVLEHNGSVMDEDKVICHLFTLGEVVQLCPGKVPERVFLLVQSMIASPCITSPPASQSQPSSENNNVQSQPQTQNGSYNSDHNSSKDKSAENLDTSKGSQQSGSSQGSQVLTQFRGCVMSNRVRAFAFITLGKLCLQNEHLAKKCIAALARELEISKEPAIRNNVMIVMCDLCVRYPTTANHYIGNIASCLKDPSPLVRKQTLTLITRLLQEDFLKWKGALFYRFISVLLDNCEEIKKLGEFCLLHLLILRHPNMFFQHFMECVFHFNDYKNHSVYNRFPQSEKDRLMFSLKGEKNVKKRLTLYKFLLENMSDDHKFQIQSKIVQDVLGATVDDLLPINPETSDILKDSFTILSCKEIKLSSLKVQNNEEVGGDVQEIAAVVVATAKKTVITQVLKKNVIENIVPVVASLKHKFEKERSPLLKELYLYLRELMKDYKNEIKEILSTDRQLAVEIEYDLRKFEEQQLEEARKRSLPTSAQGSPSVRVGTIPAQVAHAQSPSASRVNSPRLPGSPLSIGTPRTPALKKGPRTAGPGKGTPPVLRLISQRNTPAKEAPLSTVAMLNFARSVLKQLPTPTAEGEENVQQNVTPEGTPKQRLHRTQRAVSTPSVSMGNITFQGDGNMTFMPPSPIAESSEDQRLYDSDTLLPNEDSDKEN